MNSTPHEILSRYWGYSSFRELQLEIIESILRGHDTLGLLPTGGGKSITFQVPAMMLPGLTLVITPLISLMKDQVDNLRDRGIKAVTIHSGLSRAEHNLAMDRFRLGKASLLYLSPEKLLSRSFVDQLSSMSVSMIVVDEAHCISQWGYDFRPSYLKIAEVRKLFPEAPVLALTASATPEVARDIMDRLHFRQHVKFTKSFTRSNISYIVRHAEHKPDMLLKVLSSTQGTSIVYVRSRKRAHETATFLNEAGISADFYHAGLSAEEKNVKQNAWKANQVRVMVATNAFGMGIDKPDVRVVAHIDPPSSLEEYYQEAGRAGRDGKPAYAVFITSRSDKATLTRRLNESFPEKDTIRRIYELAGNFLDVAVGSGYNNLYEFNFTLFCERFNIKPAIARSALNLLTRAGYIEYVDEVASRARVMVVMDKRSLYDLELDPTTDKVFQLLLRTYTGLFADFVYISEASLAMRLNIAQQQVYDSLLKLARLGAIHYIPRKNTPYILYTTSRELPKHVVLTHAVYEEQRHRMANRLEAMKQFLFTDTHCRVNTMLRYFGETPAADCGTCDVCRQRRKSSADNGNAQRCEEGIRYILGHGTPQTVPYLAHQLSVTVDELVPVIRRMLDRGDLNLSGSRLSLPTRQ